MNLSLPVTDFCRFFLPLPPLAILFYYSTHFRFRTSRYFFPAVPLCLIHSRGLNHLFSDSSDIRLVVLSSPPLSLFFLFFIIYTQASRNMSGHLSALSCIDSQASRVISVPRRNVVVHLGRSLCRFVLYSFHTGMIGIIRFSTSSVHR